VHDQDTNLLIPAFQSYVGVNSRITLKVEDNKEVNIIMHDLKIREFIVSEDNCGAKSDEKIMAERFNGVMP